MNIYVTKTNDPKVLGVAHAIEEVVGEAFFFDLNTTSMFDLLETKRPEIVLLETKDLPKAHLEYAKAEYPATKFILFNDRDSQTQADLVIDLKNKSSNWYLPNLVDTAICTDGQETPFLKCDFAMFTDNVDQENVILKEWLEILGQRFNIKLFGSKKIDCSYYAGNITQENIKNVYSSVKGLIMVENSNFENCLANGIAPVPYSNTKNFEYSWDNLDSLCSCCEKVLNETKDFYSERTAGTYIEFVNRIKEELKI